MRPTISGRLLLTRKKTKTTTLRFKLPGSKSVASEIEYVHNEQINEIKWQPPTKWWALQPVIFVSKWQK